MPEPKSEMEIAELDDVELIRLLTVNVKETSSEVVAAATAEANRRGLPIDEAFIPSGDGGDALPGGADAEASALLRFAAGGKAVACTHCRGDRFEAHEILLNTRGLTFLKLDWLNRSATALICGKCGHVQLFAEKPTEIDEG
jgi:predicted nucleic-acid-binding Zn-ribbon protein